MADNWAAFIRRERGSEEVLFKQHYADLHRYAIRLTGDENKSRDLIQEVFLRLFEKRDRLPATVDSPRAYLLRMMRNLLNDSYRTANIKTITIEQEGLKLPITDEGNAEKSWIDRENTKNQRKKLADSLNYLTPAQREVVTLRYYQELSFEEIETVTGLQYQTIRNYLSQGLKRLRKTLK